MGKAYRSNGSVISSHSSKYMPGLAPDLNEKVNVLDSPGFMTPCGCNIVNNENLRNGNRSVELRLSSWTG